MSLIPYGLIIAFALLMQRVWPQEYSRILGDDPFWGKESFREWVSLAILFIVIGMSLWAYFKSSERKKVFLAIAVWTFLVAMEECDWTQQIFFFPTPEFFLTMNAKSAMNFHNLFVPYGPMVNLLFGLPLLYFIGRSSVRFAATADGVGADVLMWIGLVLFSEVFVSHDNRGTLLQLTMYAFMGFLVVLLKWEQEQKLPTAAAMPLYRILLSSEQRKDS